MRARFALSLILLLAAGSAAAQPCLVGYTFTQSPPPVNGTYGCGETVTFCFTVTFWNSTNANWFHGIVANFGPGWDLSTLTPGTPPPSCSGNGSWGWYTSVQGTAGTNIGPQGPGFFYNNTLPADGNPGNNFGDFCVGAVNWQFCWTISVLSGPACVSGTGLGVTFNTFGDSETGSWGSAGCGSDPVVPSTPAVIQACAVNAGTNGALTFCANGAPASLSTGLGGTPDAGGAWTTPGGAPFSGIFNPAADAPGAYTYTVSSASPPCTASATVTVAVNPQPNAGTSASVTLCASDAPVNLFTALGGTPDAGGSWSGPGGASSGTFDPAADAPGAYTYSIVAAAPCTNASATVTVNVNPTPNAGSNGALTLCSTSAPADLFGALGGSPSPGGTWSGPSGIASGTFNPAADAAGTYTYTVNGTTPCPNSSASVTVAVNPAPNAGANASATLCNTDVPLALTSLLNGSPGPGGTWTAPDGTSIPGTLNPASAASGNYLYTVTGAAPCPDASATLSLTINSQGSAGTSATLNLCNASPATDLFNALGGSPNAGGSWSGPNGPVGSSIFTPGSSAPGVYTYTVNSPTPCVNSTATVTVNVSPQPNAGVNGQVSVCTTSTPTDLFTALGASAQSGGAWTAPDGSPFSGILQPGTASSGTYTYTITGTPPCSSASATVTVSITTASNPGSGTPLTVCSTGAPVALSASLSGNPQTGGTWTAPNGSAMSGTLNPATAASGNYTYTLAANGPCPSVSATVPVSVSQAVNAGVAGSHTLCSSNAAPYNLINALGGAPSPGGIWTSPNGAPHGPTFSAASDAAGVYTYTVNAPAPCPSASSTVTMLVVQVPNAGNGGAASLCVNGPAVDPFGWLSGNPQPGGTWTAPGGSTITQVDPATANSGAYVYTVAGTAPCPNASATVQLTIDALPIAGSDGALNLCADAAPATMLNYLNGAQPGGSWIGPSGSASGTFIATSNAPGIYTYTVTGTGACAGETDQAQLLVQVNPLPVPSFQFDVAAGCAPLQVQFTNEDPAGTQSAAWNFGDGGTGTGNVTAWHTYTTAGQFDVGLTVTDANGCSGTVLVQNAVIVSQGPPAVFYALPVRVSINDPSTIITHTPDASVAYSWLIDGIALDTSGTFRWTFDPPTVGEREICLTATDALGCANTLCQRVLVDDDLTIYVANAFTPNDDGKNEVFRPSILGVEPDWYEFMVFNRWGLLIFRTTDPQEGWNGGMNNSGDALPQDVYVWKLRAKDQFTPEKAELIGTVTLLR
jgi:gliding motility-associated-like protein